MPLLDHAVDLLLDLFELTHDAVLDVPQRCGGA